MTINHLDDVLRQHLIARIDEIVDDSQVRFQPPDNAWRTYVSTLTVAGQPARALNLFLVDLRENRKLRSNERVRVTVPEPDGAVREVPAPRRVDCHYLISAWSPATEGGGVEPTVDEHLLLSKVIAALNDSDPLVPRQVYAPAPLPPGFPAQLADAELPLTLLPVEGYAKLAEFWGAMGENNRFRPVVYVIATVPVWYDAQPMGGIVTTRIARHRVMNSAGPAEVWVEIGGYVVDTANPLPNGDPRPLARAWIVIETLGGQRVQLTRSDAAGRFICAPLREGDYRLRASTETLGEIVRDIHVPSPSGEYDMRF